MADAGINNLYLGFNNLTQLPDELFFLQPTLQILVLRNTGLTSLPPIIGTLDNLRELDLTGLAITELPGFIGNLHNLRVLKLAGTGITDLPMSLAHTAIKRLELHGTKITKLPEVINLLTNLRHITIGDNIDLTTAEQINLIERNVRVSRY